MQFFIYGQKELSHLKAKDERLRQAIERIGLIQREVTPDLFEALIHSIVGQQIAAKAHKTVWSRMKSELKCITPYSIEAVNEDELKSFGISFRKANYIKNAALMVSRGALDLNGLQSLSDDEVCAKLTCLKGVGVWTAEMLMLFSMQRPNIISYGDYAIRKGICMLYGYEQLDKKLFDKHKNNYAPYASTASLYLWAIAGGA